MYVFYSNLTLPVYKFLEVYKDKFIHNRGERGFLGKKLYPENAYIREHARLFGKTKFDFVIDFSGYSHYWAKYLLAADAKRKFVICIMICFLIVSVSLMERDLTVLIYEVFFRYTIDLINL